MKKLLPLITVLVLTVSLIICAIPASAKTIYTKTLSFLDIRANAKADGYEWNNYDDVLTLDGLNIETEDDYGLKILDGATVVVKGNNYIKASKAAIFIEGKVIFKGNGTLTLVADQGIYCSSDDPKDTLTINSGNFDITATGYGIVSDFHTVTITNSKIKINAENGTAIKANRLNISVKTNVSANAPIIGTDRLHIDGASVTVNTSSEALQGNSILLTKLKLNVGSDKSSLTVAENYEGQACVKTVSTYDDTARSVILGDKFGAFFDVLIFVGIAVVLAAVVVLPIVIKKKKAKAAIEARDKAEEERKAEARAKKKAAKLNH